MTNKQRLLGALRGESIDRTPYSPFLAYWWDSQPQARRDAGQLSYLLSIGADPLLRGFSQAWTVEYPGVETQSRVSGNRRVDTMTTPVGNLSLGYHYSADGNTWFLHEHPVSTAEDLKVLMWIYEHARITYNSAADDMAREIGEDGLLLPLLGSETKTCFQSLVEKWCGTVDLTYLIADDPDMVQSCLDTMRRISDQTAVLSAQSSCEAFIFWEDSSTTNISPGMFRQYTAPEITFWGDTLHAAGKMLVHHACGHLRDLLPLMAQTPVDAIESISPPPTGNIDLDEAFPLLPDRIGLIGGLEPVFLLNCSMDELAGRVAALKKTASGRRFILANSDSCPPGVSEETLRAIVGM